MLFRQVFSRGMESLSSPVNGAVPLVARGEFDRVFAGRVSQDALAQTARAAGLESAALQPRCVAYRRISEPGDTRQLYFLLFDSPAFEKFRADLASLLDAQTRAAYDPAALSPVLLIGSSDPTFSRWLPLRATPESDCVAPVTVN